MSEFRGDIKTFPKHHALDQHTVCCATILCVFIFMPLFGGAFLGMRTCLQCMCKHGLNFHGGCRTWVLCFFGAAVVALQSDLRVEDIWDGAIRFDPSPCKLLLPTLLK